MSQNILSQCKLCVNRHLDVNSVILLLIYFILALYIVFAKKGTGVVNMYFKWKIIYLILKYYFTKDFASNCRGKTAFKLVDMTFKILWMEDTMKGESLKLGRGTEPIADTIYKKLFSLGTDLLKFLFL